MLCLVGWFSFLLFGVRNKAFLRDCAFSSAASEEWWYPKGDIFSMGIVFFQMMIGQVPNGEIIGVLQTSGRAEEARSFLLSEHQFQVPFSPPTIAIGTFKPWRECKSGPLVLSPKTFRIIRRLAWLWPYLGSVSPARCSS